MRRSLLTLIPLSLVGCTQLENAQAVFANLTNPLVVEGLVISVEAPDIPGVDLSGTDFSSGTAISIFLADVQSAADLANAPISGATVTVAGVDVAEVSDGAYVHQPDPAITYSEGGTFDLNVTIDSSTATASFDLPPAIQLTVAPEHDLNSPLTLEFAGQDFTAAIVVLYSANDADFVFNNTPGDIAGLYEFISGDLANVEIPASAFAGEGVYALGVAGIKRSSNDTVEQMNSLLSVLSAGQMKFYPISTIPIPAL